MAWLIIRIEPKFETYNRTADGFAPPESVVAQLHKRHANTDPTMTTIEELLNKSGFELGPMVGPCPKSEQGKWPLTAYIYVSPNKEGYGRGASTLASGVPWTMAFEQPLK